MAAFRNEIPIKNMNPKLFLVILSAALFSCSSVPLKSAGPRLSHPLSTVWVVTDKDGNIYKSPELTRKLKEK